MGGLGALAVIVTIAILAAPAHADPSYSLTASANPALSTNAQNEVLLGGGLRLAVEYERFHAGTRLGLARGGTMTITEALAEAGARFQPGRCVGMWIGWRVGHSGFVLDRTIRDLYSNAITFQLVVELTFPLRDRFEVRFAPFVPTVYNSGLWHIAARPEIGIAYRF